MLTALSSDVQVMSELCHRFFKIMYVSWGLRCRKSL
nr:MAG TPA: hypothetical protein [Caudoviricetes sp.]